MKRRAMVFPLMLILLLSACGSLSIQLEYEPSPIGVASPTFSPSASLTPELSRVLTTPVAPGAQAADPELPSLWPIATMYTPTATSHPELLSTPDLAFAKHIRFEPGVTAMGVTDLMPPSLSVDYILSAEKGQLLALEVEGSVSNGVGYMPLEVMVMRLPEGLELGSQARSWKGILPDTAEYLIRVRGGNPLGHYTLYVSMPRWVEFPPGGGAVSIDGRLGPQVSVADGTFFPLNTGCYVIDGKRGQKLSASISSSKNQAYLDIIKDNETHTIDAPLNTGRIIEGNLLSDGIYWVMPMIPPAQEVIPFNLQISLAP